MRWGRGVVIGSFGISWVSLALALAVVLVTPRRECSEYPLPAGLLVSVVAMFVAACSLGLGISFALASSPVTRRRIAAATLTFATGATITGLMYLHSAASGCGY